LCRIYPQIELCVWKSGQLGRSEQEGYLKSLTQKKNIGKAVCVSYFSF